MKKLLSIVLAMVMLSAIATTAFAMEKDVEASHSHSTYEEAGWNEAYPAEEGYQIEYNENGTVTVTRQPSNLLKADLCPTGHKWTNSVVRTKQVTVGTASICYRIQSGTYRACKVCTTEELTYTSYKDYSQHNYNWLNACKVCKYKK